MKLEFKLLIIDDNPDTIHQAIEILSDHLNSLGFSLDRSIADDLSLQGLRDLARRSGREYDLVVVDYNLGRADLNGAMAAAKIRRELQYTDMVFYSSDPSINLFDELATQQVSGIFVADRQNIAEALTGLADTVIGKAIDLNHMRGIAMAEVAEMDVIMEDILERVFSSNDDYFIKKGEETLRKLVEGVEARSASLKTLVDTGTILEVVSDSMIFSSNHKFMAVKRVAKSLQNKPTDALTTLNTYEQDVIQKRNTLAHAKEENNPDGSIALRSIKRDQSPITIDDAWMVAFRNRLREQRHALMTVCTFLGQHLDGIESGNESL